MSIFNHFALDVVHSDEYGDVEYEVFSKRYGQDRVIVSPSGKKILDTRPGILSILYEPHPGNVFRLDGDIPYLNSVIFTAYSGGGWFHRRDKIAIKQQGQWNLPADTTSFEQLKALRTLEKNGCVVVDVLFASSLRDRLVTRWMSGSMAGRSSQEDIEKFPLYIQRLSTLVAGLARQGLWDTDIRLERQPNNYFVNNLSSTNIFEWYKILDPIFRQSKVSIG